MGFYDNYNFDGLKFFSQIKTHSSFSEPCKEFLSIVKNLKTLQKNITVAEIGIGYGATALQVLKILDANDTRREFSTQFIWTERTLSFMTAWQFVC